jgi:DNA primase
MLEYVMDSQVEEIKKKLDIVEVINHYLPLKKRGRHYLANCPFHGEKTPSFVVSPELQIFKCFGCGKAGDIFTFVEEFDHVEFKDALEDLAKMAGITLHRSEALSQAEYHHKRLVDLNSEVAKFYHYILTTHPLGNTALQYITKRGITHDSIKLFKIGFSPGNPSLIVNYLRKKGFKDDELIATGTFGFSQYHQGQLYDRFTDRLVFPLADYRDRVLGFSGRILPGSKNPNLAKYINSPETDIYHKSQMLYGLNFAKESIKKNKFVIIVEGEIDMISPFQAGITNIVALKGTAFTSDQLTLLRRYTDTLVLGLDSDFAGNNAARKSIELADSMGFDIKVLSLGDKYKDPDEAVRADLPFFQNQLTHPLPVWDFIITSALKINDASTIKGKKEILALVLPFLTKISNSVIRSDYLNKLASELGSTVESITEESVKYPTAPLPPATVFPAVLVPTPSSSKIEKWEEYLLTLIFSAQKPAFIARKISSKIEFTVPRYWEVFKKLKRQKLFHPQTFAGRLAPELQSTFQNLYLSSTYLKLESRERLHEIQKAINKILSISYKEQIVDLSSQIAQAQSLDQDDLVDKLLEQQKHLLSQLSLVEMGKS